MSKMKNNLVFAENTTPSSNARWKSRIRLSAEPVTPLYVLYFFFVSFSVKYTFLLLFYWILCCAYCFTFSLSLRSCRPKIKRITPLCQILSGERPDSFWDYRNILEWCDYSCLAPIV